MNLTYEEAFNRLEQIIGQLQSEDVNLDEAIDLFKQGVELQKHCNTLLIDAEKKVAKVLNEAGELEDFIHEKDE